MRVTGPLTWTDPVDLDRAGCGGLHRIEETVFALGALVSVEFDGTNDVLKVDSIVEIDRRTFGPSCFQGVVDEIV